MRYGLPQARQPILEEVVGSALSHTFYGRFFTNGAAHDNEGNIQTTLGQQTQRTQGIKLWQGIVGENHVDSLMQIGEVVWLSLDPLPVRLKPRPAQFMQHEFGVRRVVFEDQNMQGNRHASLAIASKAGGASGRFSGMACVAS